MTPEQAHAAQEFKKLRGVDPFGPFIPLLRSPELMLRVSALGEYLRYRSALPPRLSELAILVTAAHWHQQFEWDIHAPIALQAGIPQPVLDDLWADREPQGLDPASQVLYELCVSVHSRGRPAADVVARAEAVLGTQGAMDAIGICGYYAWLAMVLNAS